jgi:hypothetical protein
MMISWEWGDGWRERQRVRLRQEEETGERKRQKEKARRNNEELRGEEARRNERIRMEPRETERKQVCARDSRTVLFFVALRFLGSHFASSSQSLRSRLAITS